MNYVNTTPEQFELYKNWVLYYLDKFRIDDWFIYFDLVKLDGDYYAKCITDSNSRAVTFAFNTEIPELTDDQIKGFSLHEVCHLLTAELVDLNDQRYVTLDQANTISESTTNKLQFLLKDK